MMAQINTWLFALTALLVGTIAYFVKRTRTSRVSTNYPYEHMQNQADDSYGENISRDIVEKMKQLEKNCVVFYGSQSGTAEDFASRLAREGALRFNLRTMVADLEDFDYHNLNKLPDTKIAIFILATYGEGEPTDNAVNFYQFMTSDDISFVDGVSAGDKPLSKLNFIVFGLGNNTYEHYNSVVRTVNMTLEQLGGRRIGKVGEGDDGSGTMEEDFLAWKESMWATLSDVMGLEEREEVYELAFAVREQREDLGHMNEKVYLGEPNKMQLEGSQCGPYNANNPFIAPITESKELFTAKDRNCLHMEIDISGSDISYTTGDHLAIWPMNSGKEVDRFLKVNGLLEKRNTVIAIRGIDNATKVPFPSPTTYDAVARYYLEIGAPISRQFVATLAQFAPTDKVRAEMTQLGCNKDYFHSKVSDINVNIAQLLEILSDGQPITKIPFSLWIEGLHKLQPRYYSISTSSMARKQKLSITTVVDSVEKANAPHIVKGITTNYLLALKQKQHGESDPYALNYALEGPHNRYNGFHIPVHIRHSNFKLPSDPSRPIIMVGPGTGVAPFRAFVQERMEQAKHGKMIGKMLLFFGCRRRDEDFLYKDEWEQTKETLGEKFEIYTAFSREGVKKIYVQHKLKEAAVEVNRLLEEKGYFYICGDAANMAREVNTLLGQIIAEQRGIEEKEAEDILRTLRTSSHYQEDVWS